MAYQAGAVTVAIMFVGFVFLLMPWRAIEKEEGENRSSMAYGNGLPIYQKTTQFSPVSQKTSVVHAP